jgi:ATP-dependent Clp protease adaptor protein ClpS
VGMASGLRLFLTIPPATTCVTGLKGTEKTQRRSQRRQPGLRGFTIHAATLPGQGGGVLDRPVLDKPTPGRESEFDIKRKKQVSPPYRVMLHNDNFNKREYVVQVLMKVIPGMTVDIAVNVMQEAHVNGLAVVIICPQHDAEEHCMQLRNNGLLSSIEPATGGC